MIMKKLILVGIIMLYLALSSFAQTCINCDTNSIASGDYSAALGNYTTASGDYSLVGGENSIAEGKRSFAFGNSVLSQGINSVALGSSSQALGDDSFAFGTAATTSGTGTIAIGTRVQAHYTGGITIGTGPVMGILENDKMESLVVGFNSIYPTLFISRAPNDSDPPYIRTGQVGIGNVTTPLAKLHILADEGEEAAMFIQPFNWDNNESSTLYLGSLNTYITANKESGISFNSESNYVFANDANVGINTDNPSSRLQVKDGDIYIEDIDFGIIMKSPNGKCWRGQVDDNGQLNFSELENCPETVTSINDNKEEETGILKVFPNPSNNTLNIELEGDSKVQKQVLLYNANGMIVYTDTFVGSTAQINVSEFNSGIYIVKVGSEGNYVSRKVSIN